MSLPDQFLIGKFNGRISLQPETLLALDTLQKLRPERWTIYFNYETSSLYIGSSENTRYLEDATSYLQFEGANFHQENSLDLSKCTIIYHANADQMPEMEDEGSLKKKMGSLFDSICRK